MTIIVGVESKGKVYLGADSAATGGGQRTLIKDPKVFIRDGVYALGVCGQPKVMDGVHHVIKFPKQSGGSDRAFLVNEFVPTLRDGLIKLDCASKDRAGNWCYQGAMLLGYRGKVYILEGNFQLIHSSQGYAAEGSGSPYALGYLKQSKESDPKKKILQALESATQDVGCAPPFVIISV